jgi:hypothetical protein
MIHSYCSMYQNLISFIAEQYFIICICHILFRRGHLRKRSFNNQRTEAYILFCLLLPFSVKELHRAGHRVSVLYCTSACHCYYFYWIESVIRGRWLEFGFLKMCLTLVLKLVCGQDGPFSWPGHWQVNECTYSIALLHYQGVGKPIICWGWTFLSIALQVVLALSQE